MSDEKQINIQKTMKDKKQNMMFSPMFLWFHHCSQCRLFSDDVCS